MSPEETKEFLIRELQRGKISGNAVRKFVADVKGFEDWADRADLDGIEAQVALHEALTGKKREKFSLSESLGMARGEMPARVTGSGDEVKGEPKPRRGR